MRFFEHAPHAKPSPRSRALLAVCALLLLPAPLFAAEVDLVISRNQAFVGETIRLNIVVSAVDDLGSVQNPAWPTIPNADLRYVGPRDSYSQSIINGRVSTNRERIYQYQLTPRAPGVIRIPPLEVTADGATHLTQATKIVVNDVPVAAPPADNATTDDSNYLSAQITTDADQLFDGQQAEFRLAVWVRVATHRNRPLSATNMLRMLTGNIKPFDEQDRSTRRVRRQLSNGESVLFDVFEFSTRRTITEPGPVEFPAIMLEIDYPLAFSQDIFGTLRVTRNRTIRVRPEVLVPEAQPLPTENRPPDFTGLVGSYTLATEATPRDVRVGDPIELIIDISGSGALDTLPAPRLSENEELLNDFLVPDETLAGTMVAGRRRFTQVIRAKRPDVSAVPPIQFPYFDPELGEYRVARSEPIPLSVRAAESLNTSDLEIAAPPTDHEGIREIDGLRGIRTRTDELLVRPWHITTLQIQLAALGPPLAAVTAATFILVSRRSRGAARRRREQAAKRARQRIVAAEALPPAAQARDIEAALVEYLADRLDLPPARFTGNSAVEFLRARDLDADLVNRWTTLIADCEQASYAGSAATNDLAGRARACVAQTEKVSL